MSTIDPSNIQLSDGQRRLVAQVAEKTGKAPSEVLDEAVSRVPVQDDQAGKRLRQILDRLSHEASGISDAELDSVMDEAIQHARHGKS